MMKVMDDIDAFQDRWLLRPRPLKKPAVRLFALPYAGATGTVYHSWHKELDEGIELCAIMLPGRLSRIDEPSYSRLDELAEALIRVVTSLDDAPYVFFGHSMGALMAWYLTHRLNQRGHAMPRHLILSGHGAPNCLSHRHALQHLSDDEFIFWLKRYDGIPDVIANEPELLRLVIPALRADFLVLDQMAEKTCPPLDIPFSVLNGSDDRNVEREAAEAWRDLTRGSCHVKFFPGGHFFIQPQRSAVIQYVNQVCRTVN